MTNNGFIYLGVDKDSHSEKLIERADAYAVEYEQQIYIINKPLGDLKYDYSYKGALIILMPKHKISFVDLYGQPDDFDEYCDEVIEDLGSISDKYRYKEQIGRPRHWQYDLIQRVSGSEVDLLNERAFDKIVQNGYIADPSRQRICELLISLLTGSINDIDHVKASIPENVLEKVKRKIILFDGDQTRFIYEKLDKPLIKIQGLSGTGKTELLLHKLKELYVLPNEPSIAFTCHNKILAASLKARIPEFFNFMKVEQQIEWDIKLWCMHAWGSRGDPNSGVYRKICAFYNLPFEPFGASFDNVCMRALKIIRESNAVMYLFDYMLVDESQDFPDSFFELCQAVTKTKVYIAGDIFQNIFGSADKNSIDSDYLLSKCYRTDPRTLMFAHGLGMGLFEDVKLKWLTDDEWKACGYIMEVAEFDENGNPQLCKFKREPLRRFEDIDRDNYKSVEIIKVFNEFFKEVCESIVRVIRTIKGQNPTVSADDIGVIFLDADKWIYRVADELEIVVAREFDWQVNKAYESKCKEKGKLFVSNKNNVKGLEFPFVVCVAKKIRDSYEYRNALYMSLTRSFLQTYLVLGESENSEIIQQVESGLDVINRFGFMEVEVPSKSDQEKIRFKIQLSDRMSLHEMVQKVIEELGDVSEKAKNFINSGVQAKSFNEDSDYESVREFIIEIYSKVDD